MATLGIDGSYMYIQGTTGRRSSEGTILIETVRIYTMSVDALGYMHGM